MAQSERNDGAQGTRGEQHLAQLLVLALHVVDRLHVEFDVARDEKPGLDAELERPPIVRPTVALIPRNAEAAPLTVAFTAAPAVHVRFGRWYTRAFPPLEAAPHERSFEEERERLLWRVVQLVEGRFREAIAPGPPGKLVLQHGFWSPDGARAGGECKIDVGENASSMQAAVEWQPWTPRKQRSY